MKKSIYIIIPLVLLFGYTAFAQSCLEIEITNMRSQKGQILISLCNSKDQFPKNAPKEFKDIVVSKNKIESDKLNYEFQNIKPGKYALALLDDENKSGDMDFSRLGLPLEGFGFSNNAKPFLSDPPFKKCAFDVKKGENKIIVKVQYR